MYTICRSKNNEVNSILIKHTGLITFALFPVEISIYKSLNSYNIALYTQTYTPDLK
jgi:hypothetical protein